MSSHMTDFQTNKQDQCICIHFAVFCVFKNYVHTWERNKKGKKHFRYSALLQTFSPIFQIFFYIIREYFCIAALTASWIEPTCPQEHPKWINDTESSGCVGVKKNSVSQLLLHCLAGSMWSGGVNTICYLRKRTWTGKRMMSAQTEITEISPTPKF